MSLTDRSIGSELSEVEKALIFDKKFSNTGYVEYDTNNGEYFYLHPSPFKKTLKNEIYHTTLPPPPEHMFVETIVADEQTLVLDNFGDKWITVKEISHWERFDPSPLAAKRKTCDFLEIIDFLTYPYKGEADSVQEIAGCTSLFAFSSPPEKNHRGGINSAILAREFQWNLFTKPLRMIPPELRKPISDYYYYISKIERKIKKESGEINVAILRPKKLQSDIPIVILDESQKKISKEYQGELEISSKVITTHLLDALLLQPHSTKKIEKMMLDEVYRMREECFSAALMPFVQNLDAIPKLASAYCRLQSNPEIKTEDVRYVTDLWFSMRKRADKIDASPIKTSHLLELTGQSAKVFLKLYEIFGSDTEISLAEAAREMKLGWEDFELAIDSLENKGYCIRKLNSFVLLDPWKKDILKKKLN